MIIISEDGKRRKISEDVLNLVEHLKPVAKRLNSYEKLLNVQDILENGCSASRQRAVFAESGSLEAVVDSLIKEFATDTPVRVG